MTVERRSAADLEGRGCSRRRRLFSLRSQMAALFALMAIGFIGSGLWVWFDSIVPDGVVVEGTIAEYDRDGRRETMTISFTDPETGQFHTIGHRRRAQSGPLVAEGRRDRRRGNPR